MKTKMIFTIATLLMLGSVCMNAQKNSNGSTPTDYSKQYFTIVPVDGDITISWMGYHINSTSSFKLYWSKDNGETWSGGRADWHSQNVKQGEKIMFYANAFDEIGSIYSVTGRFNVEGNIMSLVYGKDFLNPNTEHFLVQDFSHNGGFLSNLDNLISAENLVIPAVKTDNYRIILSNMFKGCTSLTKAPLLLAATLTENCYEDMFSGCTSLNYIKCLATDISATDCTKNWLDGVSSSGTFVKASSMNSWPSGASGIPSGWTVTNAQNSKMKRTIHVATAGTLPDLISADEKYQIEELTLTGELNGTDFKFIREMAGDKVSVKPEGIYTRVFHDSTEGILKSLDISNARIVEGGENYNYINNAYNVTGLSTIDNKITVGLFSQTNLKSIILPNTVTTIDERIRYMYMVSTGGTYGFDGEESAFGYISAFPKSLISITIPNSVTSIGSYAFSGCSGLSSINIPNSVTSIGDYAFQGCSGLTSIKVESDNENYDSRNNCNAIIETSSNTLIVGCKNTIIPNSVTSIGSYVFYYCSGLTSINIPNSVTSIGDYAFQGCSGLTSAIIGNGVTSIGDYAFYGCSCLKSITIPNSVTSIGEWAFSGCSGLTSVTIPNSVTSIGNYAFRNCSSLTSVTIPSSVTSIGGGAFYNCSSLTSINIPNSVTSIGNGAFYGCSGLTSIVSQIKNPFEINDNVFPSNNYSTATLTVPFGTKSVYETTNGWKNFQNIVEAPSSKRTIHVATAGTLPNLISEDEKYQIEELTLTGELNGTDFKFIREMAGDKVSYERVSLGDVYHNPTEGILTSLDISNAKIVKGGENYNYYISFYELVGLSTIDDKITAGLFSRTNLKSIILPNTVTSIDKGISYTYMASTGSTYGHDGEEPRNGHIYVFPTCLTSITIPSSVTSIGVGALFGTVWYNNQPDGLVYAGKVAYKYKGEMPANTNIIIKDGTLGIAGGAFEVCRGLTSITIPNSVISIGDLAFCYCSGLNSVTIPNSVTSIGDRAFEGCSGLNSVNIPNSVTSIGDRAFEGCSGLVSVTIPNSVTSIGVDAFSSTAWYNNQPDGLVYAGKVAYKYKGEMPANTSISIKEGTLGITGSAFRNCSGLTSVTIPNSVTSIGNYAFYICSGLTSITIPNSVTSIGDWAFSYCSGLTSITIPNSVTSIGDRAFYGCSGLTSVTIPNSVTSIGDRAFYQCSGLTSIVSQINNPFEINDNVFPSSIYSTTTLTVPFGTKSVYETTNGWKNFQNIVEAPSSKRTIHVATAGTLPDLISAEEKYQIEELTLTGELNGTDFKFIREMAGDEVSYKESARWTEDIHNPTKGILKSLDISNARIVKGGEVYNCYIYSVRELGSLSTEDNAITPGLFIWTKLESILLPNSVTSVYGMWYWEQDSPHTYMGAFPDCLKSVSIPNSVISIGNYAFYNCSDLTSVTIPNSVTSIGDRAFSGCNGLTSITIPNSVTSIGDYAFHNCNGLTSVTIPNSMTSIGSGAFDGCSGLTSIVSQIKNPFDINDGVFPSSIYSTATLTVPFETKSVYETTSGWKNFQNIVEAPSTKRTIHVATAGTLPDLISEDEKYQIEELTLTGELNGTDFKFIREMAGDEVLYPANNVPFYVHHNPTEGILTSLDITNARIVEGGDAYFYYIYLDRHVGSCFTKDNAITPGLFTSTKLESILLPNSVTSVSGITYYEESQSSIITYIGAFPHWLKSVTIPQSVTSINAIAFSECTSLNSIKIESGNQCYDSRNDCNAIIETNTNTLVAGCKNTIIPNSVTSIGASAFSGCSGLTSITIPNSVTSIGDRAFYRCRGLNSVTIGNSVTSIGEYTFYYCGLTSVTIPNSVTSIGDRAFYRCRGLNSVTIGNSVTSIRSGTFEYCSGLTSITIPNSVTSIGERAFYGCSGLTSITIPNGVTSIGSAAFCNCSGLTSITIPNSVTSIKWYAFQGCSSLTKVVSKIKNPFKIDASVFPSDIYTNAELVVPAGTKSLYEATEGWNKFSKITELLPTLETLPAQPMSTTKARLIATVNEADDDQHYGFEWLRYNAPDEMPPYKVSAPLYDGHIIGSLGGLNPDVYYKYRAFYKSDAGEMVYGEWIPFLTGDANVFFEPEVHTKDAIVTNDGALLSAVFIEGTEDIQEKGFEYWPMNSNARAVSLTRGDNIGSVIVSGNNTSVTIEGLKAGTEYGYRPYVKTASGTTYGEERSFVTSTFGDVNGDNKVDNDDLNDLVSYIMGNNPEHFDKDAADLNNDKKVNAADIVKMVKILK